jgi:hypothetical protein
MTQADRVEARLESIGRQEARLAILAIRFEDEGQWDEAERLDEEIERLGMDRAALLSILGAGCRVVLG